MLPEQINDYEGDLVLTTTSEVPKSIKIPVLYEEVLNFEPTVIRGLIMQKLCSMHYSSELLIGIDPGKRIGLAINYYGVEIEQSLHISIEDLVSHLIKILAGLCAKKKILKIGNGDMKLAKIKNYNQRGKRDMLSAKYIIRREGRRHFVLPLSRIG